MTSRNFVDKVTERLSALPQREIYFVLSSVTLTATLNILRVTYNVGYSHGWADGAFHANGTSLSGYNPLLLRQIIVGVSLVISAVGLWSHKGVGFFISALALICIGWQYVDWWLYSHRWLEQAGLTSFTELQDPNLPHVGELYGASWWDIIAFMVTAILLIWHIKTLASIRKSSEEAQ